MSKAEYPLGEVATIVMGTSPKSSTYNNDGTGLPLLNGPTEFGVTYPNCTLFTTDSKRNCEPGDLIFCVRGSTTGRMNWADQTYSLGRGVCSIRGGTRLDTKYIKYCLDWKLDELLNLAGGGTFPNLTKDSIHDFKIPYPECRHKIAAVLSAYDDLIENNTRRIAILEEMARRLYREWFVHFRFPGHEDMEMVGIGGVGRVPKGWCTGRFSDIASQIRTNVNPVDFPNEIFAHYSFPAFDENQRPAIEKGETIRSNKYEVIEGCVLLSKLNPRIPRVWYPYPSDFTHRSICSTEFLVLLPKGDITSTYLFSLCSSTAFLSDFQSLTLGTSTSHQRVKPKDVEKMRVLVPTDDLIGTFTEIAKPMLAIAHILRLKNVNLRQTRDLLLPRLISGQLDVSYIRVPDTLEALGTQQLR